MNYLVHLVQEKEAPKLIEKIEPMSLDSLYALVINWLILNGPKIIIALFIFFIGRWIIRLCRKWFRNAMNKRSVHNTAKPFIESLVVVALQVILFIILMQILGVRLTVFAAAM